jgi:tetratricopeptide (TPR) repeat protein
VLHLWFCGDFRPLTVSSKSEVAAEFAHRLHDASPNVSIYWINGASEGTFVKDLALVGQGSTSTPVDSLALSDIKATKDWFQLNAYTHWLMIVDNADVDTLFGPSQLHKFLPHSPRGCILVITRNRQLALRIVRPAQLIEIDGMVQEDARNLLLSYTGHVCDNTHADNLVSALELSPLAIAQAGAFIAFNSMSIRGYLYQINRSDDSASQLFLAALTHFSSTMHCTVHYQLPIASLFELHKYDANASDLLAIAACFGDADIPLTLLSAFPDADQQYKALLVLKGYSLVRSGSRDNTIELPRFTRALVRAEMFSSAKQPGILLLALKAICLTYPAICDHTRLWESCRPYQPHALSILVTTMESLNPDQLSESSRNALAYLASAICTFLVVTGHYQEVRAIILKIFGWAIAESFAQQGILLDLKSKLAISEQCLGNLPSAASLSREVFLNRKHALGSTHSKTLHSLNNLALVYGDQSFHEKAERYLREALSLKELTLGNEHLDTLITVNNLGTTLQSQKQYQAAESLFHRSLSERLRVLPLDDLDVLTSQSNLGVVYQLQGRLDEAEEIHRTVYNGRRRVLGDKHYETMKSRGNLAITINDKGDHCGAETLLRSLLDVFQHTLGKSHLDTLKTQENLAMVLHDQSKFPEAELLIMRVLSLKESIRDPAHINTLDTMEFLSIILQYQRKYAESIQICSRIRDRRIQYLGRDHADSCRSTRHLCELEEDLTESLYFGHISPQVSAHE